mgnify:CR=1 FL=1
MRIALLVVAGLALAGVLVVAVVLPQMAGAEARDAAQALLAGAEPAQQQVSAAAAKSGRLDGAGSGVKVAPRNDPKHGEIIVFGHNEMQGYHGLPEENDNRIAAFLAAHDDFSPVPADALWDAAKAGEK